MFGTLVIAYLFLGGCGSGVMFATSLLSLVFHAGRRRAPEEKRAFGHLRACGFATGCAILALSVLCLVCDLGRPDRILFLFVRPTPSYLTFGTYALLAALLVGGFLAMTGALYVPWATGRIKRAGEVACAALALGVMAYTGLYLQQMKAVAFWDTPLVPILFVLSALSTGLAVLLLVWPFVGTGFWFETERHALYRVHAAIVVLESIALGAYMTWALRDCIAARSVAVLVQEGLSSWFFGGVLACGLIAPLAIEGVYLIVRRTPPVFLSNVLVLVGGFSLRFCIVSAGMH